jgi:hypothetical protein
MLLVLLVLLMFLLMYADPDCANAGITLKDSTTGAV